MADLPRKIRLEVISPERVVVSENVDMITAPGVMGEFGVLPGHTPMLTNLSVGLLAYRNNGETQEMALAWGYAEVGPGKVIVLAEAAEKAEEIDVERAESSRNRAVDRLAQGEKGMDSARAKGALDRAALRLRVAGKE